VTFLCKVAEVPQTVSYAECDVNHSVEVLVSLDEISEHSADGIGVATVDSYRQGLLKLKTVKKVWDPLYLSLLLDQVAL